MLDQKEQKVKCDWDYLISLGSIDVQQPLYQIACSSDGKFIACTSVHKIILFDTKDGSEYGILQVIHKDGLPITIIDFSPDNTLIASNYQHNSIGLWNVVELKQIGDPLVGHVRSIKCIQFSPDGQFIASGGFDEIICIWDIRCTIVPKKIIRIYGWQVNMLDYSPNKKLLIFGGQEKFITVWRLDSDTNNKYMNRSKSTVLCMNHSPNGAIIAIGRSTPSIIICTSKGKHLFRLNGHRDRILTVCFSPDGKSLVSGSWDESIILWDVATRVKRIQNSEECLDTVRFSCDSRYLVFGSFDRKIYVQAII